MSSRRRARRPARAPPDRIRDLNWLIWTPVIVLGVLLLLVALLALLGRVAGGRYLRPIVTALAKVPFLKGGIQRMSNAALERENPELASALRKLNRYGRLTPRERQAYLEAAGQQVEMPQAPNRAARRKGPAAAASQGAARGRRKRRR
jgi:hypothetical protein